MGTTNLDDLLNQAEAQEASNDEWVLDSKYETKDFYVDEHGTVEIKNKTISNMSSHISVKGESYSQYIEFKINRFYDGVDLTTMSLAIYYEIPNVGGDESRPINVYYNEMEIKFGWAIPSEITQNNLTISLCIYFRGKLPDGKEYVLKTKPAKYLIDNGLEFGSGIIQPTNNWYLNFVLEMDSKVNIATNAAAQSLNSLNTVKDSESIVLQYKHVVEEKAETVNEQYLEVQTMHMETKNYRDEAEQFRNEAEQFTPDGYDSLVEQVNKNAVAINTVVEKADLGIKETASGEEIYLFDSSNGKPPEFYLFGKATQNTTSGKNLLENTAKDLVHKGITFTVNEDKSVTANGINDGTGASLFTVNSSMLLEEGKSYIASSKGSYDYVPDTEVWWFLYDNVEQKDIANSKTPSFTYNGNDFLFRILVRTNVTVNNLTLYPMIRLASITDDTWEPYTGGIPSPNPDYPQDIEVTGESYNLLENTATATHKNGIDLTVNDDKSVTLNGTATIDTIITNLNEDMGLKEGEYILSGSSNLVSLFVDRFTSDNKFDKEWLDRSKNFVKFPVTAEDLALGKIFKTRAVISKDVVVNNETIYPMIRKASVKNDRYMPYGKGSVEVKSVGKNKLKNTATSQTINDVTFTVNKDKSITASGTSTGITVIAIKDKVYLKKVGKYNLSGCPSGGSGTTYRLLFGIKKADGTSIADIIDYGNGASFSITQEMIDSEVYGSALIYVFNGYTANNLTFYPMIRLVSDTDDTYEPYKETISTIQTTDFAGIKVDSGGNYTDSNGQQWICDEIVKYADGSGAFVQRIKKVVYDGVNKAFTNKSGSTKSNIFFANSSTPNIKLPSTSKSLPNVLCSCFKGGSMDDGYYNGLVGIYQHISIVNVYFSFGLDTEITTLELANAWLVENPMTLYYALAEPIRTPLTSEQIAEIEKLSTFYPVTNISNDFDCGMKVKYIVDSKNYIDNQLAIQAKLQEEALLNMLLLMPEEVQASMIEKDTNKLLSESEV